MRTKATVVAIEGDIATVLCHRTSACDGCHKLAEGGECGVCSLLGSGRTVTAKAANHAGAAVGDTVEIESDTGRVIWTAALVFVLPLLAVFGGYALSGLWFERQLWRVLFALGTFVLTFVGLRLYSELGRRGKTDIRIVAVCSGLADAAQRQEE